MAGRTRDPAEPAAPDETLDQLLRHREELLARPLFNGLSPQSNSLLRKALLESERAPAPKPVPAPKPAPFVCCGTLTASSSRQRCSTWSCAAGGQYDDDEDYSYQLPLDAPDADAPDADAVATPRAATPPPRALSRRESARASVAGSDAAGGEDAAGQLSPADIHRQLDRLETSLGRMDDAGEAMPVEQRIRTLRSMTSAAELLRDARRRHAGASLPPESAANSSPDRPTGSDAQFEAARERELEAARAAREKADAHMREAEEALSLMKRCTFRF